MIFWVDATPRCAALQPHAKSNTTWNLRWEPFGMDLGLSRGHLIRARKPVPWAQVRLRQEVSEGHPCVLRTLLTPKMPWRRSA